MSVQKASQWSLYLMSSEQLSVISVKQDTTGIKQVF